MICKKTFGENRETNLTLRASLCKNQTSWEMKISTPLQILHAVRRSGGMRKNALFKGAALLLPW